MAQSYKNQLELAQDMASSLYKLADDLDLISSNIQRNINILQNSGLFREITDTLQEYFNSYYVPNTKRIIVDTIKNNVLYIKKQEEELGNVINIRERPNGAIIGRDLNDFRFMKDNT